MLWASSGSTVRMDPVLEAALQQVHGVEPDALKGLPVHRVARLLRVHLRLRAAADMWRHNARQAWTVCYVVLRLTC